VLLVLDAHQRRRQQAEQRAGARAASSTARPEPLVANALR